MDSILGLLFPLLLAGAPSASAQVPAAGLTRIGAAAAVKGAVLAQAPGTAVGRVVASGKPLFLNDHVTTDAAGRLQVLLLDETVFTMGPNSDMVLDEFVYDPATSAGKVTARVTKGVFRFVTGKVARKDPGSMKVKLPVGTIGIRGTIAGGQVSDAGSTIILFGPGAQNNANENPGSVAVGNAGSEVVITQPGFGTTIAPGQPPAAVTNMGGQALQILGSLGEAPQQSGSGGGAGGGAGGASPSQQSGQNTAAGSGNAGTAGAMSDFSGGLNNTQTLASQIAAAASTITDGLANWDQVRGVQTGVGSYIGSGVYTCTAGSCVGYPGAITFQLDVDFGARTYGGGTSSINLSGTVLNDTTNIQPTSFSGLTGSTQNTPLSVNNIAFNTSTIALMNRGGVAAKDAVLNMVYSTSVTMAVGGAVGTRTTP